MKKLFPYILLLALSLGLAYQASLPDQGTAEAETQWLKLDSTQIKSLSYQMQKKTVIGHAKADQSYWFEVTSTKPADPPPKDSAKKPESVPPVAVQEVTETEVFKANAKMEQVVKFFASLQAKRQLGPLLADKRSAYGFEDGDHASVTITLKDDKKYQFEVGGKSYGSSNVYLWDKDRNELLLVQGASLSMLEHAEKQLIEHRITDKKDSDLSRIAIQRGQEQATWYFDSSKAEAASGWRHKSDDSEGDPALSSWVEKVLKLRISRYGSADQQKVVDQLPPLFSITLKSDQADQDVFVFKKQQGPDSEYWVKSQFLGYYGKASQGHIEAIEKDLPGLMKGPE